MQKIKNFLDVIYTRPPPPYIALADLYKIKDEAIIVSDYVKDMRKLRDKNVDKKIIVYCNGKTCIKSYKAALKCKHNNIKGIISYDAGIIDWVKKCLKPI